MRYLRKYIRITIALGVLSLLAVLFSHLALTDIVKGESDIALEWNVLRASALVILIFIISSLVTLQRILKMMP